jgi:hypothetical protein
VSSLVIASGNKGCATRHGKNGPLTSGVAYPDDCNMSLGVLQLPWGSMAFGTRYKSGYLEHRSALDSAPRQLSGHRG